jgi:nitrogen fixation protein NifB
MHLPVAPRCNIQCNYCSRKFDCANESRPGVTSEILSPEEAVEKVRMVKEKIPYLSVIGIAGPGDPLANEETFRTLELVHKEFPEMTLCISTNGLRLPENVERLKELGVRFVTVTINAIEPKIGAEIYSFVRPEGKALRGEEGAKALLDKQLEGIKKAVDAGILVKANVVMVPGVNAEHIPAVAKKVKELGAYIVNIIPLIPVPGTAFEDKRAPTTEERKKLQDACEVDIRQMRHCRHCRADAIGLLGEDRSAEFAHTTCQARTCASRIAPAPDLMPEEPIKVAVASHGRERVDLHFGQAHSFMAFSVSGDATEPLDDIKVDAMPNVAMFGEAHRGKLEGMVAALKGFDIVVAESFGEPVRGFLSDEGISYHICVKAVDEAVRDASDVIRKKRKERG